MTGTREFIAGDGCRIAYRFDGDPGRPVLLLSNSIATSHRMWDGQIAELSAAFRVLRYDMRGHGGSDAPVGAYSLDRLGRDVLELLDALGVARFAVVGVSQGGFIALRMALLAPERISALAVMGTSAAEEDPNIAATYRQLAVNWVDEGPIDPIVDMVAAICLGSLPADDWKAKWRARPLDTVEQLIGVLVERDSVLARVGDIDCPALVLHGSADLAYPLERARELADALPKAAPLVVVDGGAHFLSLTNAAEVNAQLKPFLLANALD